jgi:hypothetical protein
VYVALTRSKNKLLLPPDLFEQSPEKMKSGPIPKKSISRSAKTSIGYHQSTEFQAYSPWTIESDRQLRKMVRENVSIKQIAARLGRKPGAILSRMKKLSI